MSMRRLFILREPTERRDRTTDYLLREVLKQLNKIERTLQTMQQQVTEAFDALNEKVANIETQDAAAVALLQGLNAQLQEALSNQDPSEVVAAVQAISDRLATDADSLAAAVAANTPAAPAPAPTDTGTGEAGTGEAGQPAATNDGA